MKTREKYTIVPNVVETYDESTLIKEANERSLFSNVKANIRKYKEEIIAVPALTFIIAISTYLIVIDVFHILLIAILITFCIYAAYSLFIELFIVFSANPEKAETQILNRCIFFRKKYKSLFYYIPLLS